MSDIWKANWEYITPKNKSLPTPRNSHCSSLVEHKIYYFGGKTANSRISNLSTIIYAI